MLLVAGSAPAPPAQPFCKHNIVRILYDVEAGPLDLCRTGIGNLTATLHFWRLSSQGTMHLDNITD